MLKPDPSRLGSRLFRLISKGEIVTYGYVAVLLLVIAGSISIYLVHYILNAMLLHQPFFSTLISVINEVLLILIVMEILRTVTRLLVSPAHDVSIADLVPFLVIAGISVTRLGKSSMPLNCGGRSGSRPKASTKIAANLIGRAVSKTTMA